MLFQISTTISEENGSFLLSRTREIQIQARMNHGEKIWTQNQKINFFLNKEKFKGIYLYGKVGIGKTFLINLFINNIEKSKKFHFKHFMINLHAFVNNHSKKDFALEIYVKKLSQKYKIIFIDELHVFNIVDALLLKKYSIFFKNIKFLLLPLQIIILMTSIKMVCKEKILFRLLNISKIILKFYI